MRSRISKRTHKSIKTCRLLDLRAPRATRGHVEARGATWGRVEARGATWGREGPRAPRVNHVEPMLKESAPLPCQPAVILEDFAQLPYQPAVIVQDFTPFPYQPAVITEDFAQFPYQPAVKPHKKRHKFRKGGRRVQKRPRSMNLCKTAVKVQVARTLRTRVRATSVFQNQYSKK